MLVVWFNNHAVNTSTNNGPTYPSQVIQIAAIGLQQVAAPTDLSVDAGAIESKFQAFVEA